MLIEFSQHALAKIEVLKAHGVIVTEAMITNIIKHPDRTDIGYNERSIAQKGFDELRVLRVVYETLPEKIYVVTVYPGRRSRYEKN